MSAKPTAQWSAECEFLTADETSALRRTASRELHVAALKRSKSQESAGSAELIPEGEVCGCAVQLRFTQEEYCEGSEDAAQEEQHMSVCGAVLVHAQRVTILERHKKDRVLQEVCFHASRVLLWPEQGSTLALDGQPCNTLELAYEEDWGGWGSESDSTAQHTQELQVQVGGCEAAVWISGEEISVRVMVLPPNGCQLQRTTSESSISLTAAVFISVQSDEQQHEHSTGGIIPANDDPRVLQRYALLEEQLALCVANGHPAAYEPLSGGEAVVWVLIPIVQLWLGAEALAAWGLPPDGFISVRCNFGLSDGPNPNGILTDSSNGILTGPVGARFGRELDGPALKLPGKLRHTYLDGPDWEARFRIEICAGAEFEYNGKPSSDLRGAPAQPREPMLISRCLEAVLEERLEFVLAQEADPDGLPEDPAIQAAANRRTDPLTQQEAVQHWVEAQEMEALCIPMSWVLDADVQGEAQAKQNLLPRIARFVQRRVLLCTRHCLIGQCYGLLPPVIQGLKPMVCNREMCQKRASLLGGSCDLTAEIRRAPEVFDLLVSLTYMGAKGQLLLPFPHRIPGKVRGTGRLYCHATEPKLHGVGTAFTREVSPGDAVLWTETLPDGTRLNSVTLRVLQVLSDTELVTSDTELEYHVAQHEAMHFVVCKQSLFVQMHKGQPKKGTEQWELIAQALQRVPPVAALVHKIHLLSQEDSLTTTVNERFALWLSSLGAEEGAAHVQDSRLFDLLQYIVATNRGHLRLLAEHERIPSVSGMHTTQHQFVMLCGNPEREKLFREAKIACQADKGPDNGTLLGFHGGPPHVWNSIVRGGLEYKWQRVAQVEGAGVYFATDQNYSNQDLFCPSGAGWPNSALGVHNVKIMALCEMINRPECFRSSPETSKNNWSHYVVQHVGDRDHPKWAETEGKRLYESDPKHAGEDWVTAKVLLFGEQAFAQGNDLVSTGGGGTKHNMCADARKLRPPDVSITPCMSGAEFGGEGGLNRANTRYDHHQKQVLESSLLSLLHTGMSLSAAWTQLNHSPEAAAAPEQWTPSPQAQAAQQQLTEAQAPQLNEAMHETVMMLVGMGFDYDASTAAVVGAGGAFEEAMQLLLGQ